LTHPTADELRALSLGQLSEAELARISAHIADCPECCRQTDELGSDDPLLTRLQQTAACRKEVLVPPAARRRRRRRRAGHARRCRCQAAARWLREVEVAVRVDLEAAYTEARQHSALA
jgi:anti-sigma factor RsiW